MFCFHYNVWTKVSLATLTSGLASIMQPGLVSAISYVPQVEISIEHSETVLDKPFPTSTVVNLKSSIFSGVSNRINEIHVAQLIPDNTLGSESSILTSIDGQNYRIDGGAIRADNLFHSFSSI